MILLDGRDPLTMTSSDTHVLGNCSITLYLQLTSPMILNKAEWSVYYSEVELVLSITQSDFQARSENCMQGLALYTKKRRDDSSKSCQKRVKTIRTLFGKNCLKTLLFGKYIYNIALYIMTVQ